MTTDGQGVDGRLEGDAPSNVLPFRRDWFGPHAELIPFGPRAERRSGVPSGPLAGAHAGPFAGSEAPSSPTLEPAEPAGVDELGDPLDAGAFWSESAVSLHQPISLPDAETPRADTPGIVVSDQRRRASDLAESPPNGPGQAESRIRSVARAAPPGFYAVVAIAAVIVLTAVFALTGAATRRMPSGRAGAATLAGRFAWHRALSPALVAAVVRAAGLSAAGTNQASRTAGRGQARSGAVRHRAVHHRASSPVRHGRLSATPARSATGLSSGRVDATAAAGGSTAVADRGGSDSSIGYDGVGATDHTGSPHAYTPAGTTPSSAAASTTSSGRVVGTSSPPVSPPPTHAAPSRSSTVSQTKHSGSGDSGCAGLNEIGCQVGRSTPP